MTMLPLSSLSPLGMARAIAAGGFSPTDIAGLRIWYDFSDLATLFQDAARSVPVLADGDVIGGVTDKSGTANHGQQTITAAKAVYKVNIKNSRSAAMSVAGNAINPTTSLVLTDMTIFVVYFREALPATQNILGLADNVRGLYFPGTASEYRSLAATTVMSAAGTYPIATWLLATFQRNGTALTAYRNNANVTSGTPTNAGGLTVTRLFSANDFSRSLTGYWSEILIYGAALSGAEIAQVNGYLNAKWVVY
jgi:hypothetical protein